MMTYKKGRRNGTITAAYSVFAECHFGILLTCSSEEGLPLFTDEVVEFLPLVFFVGGHHLQEQEGFLPQGIEY